MYRNLMEIYKEVGTEKEEEIINEQYNLIDGISVDFGIMQKTRKGYVLKCEFEWDDIGSFSSMGRFLNSFRSNNVTGKTFLEQSENCFVFSKEKLVIGFGVKDLIIVDAGDVLLVMDKNKDQELKYLVNQIKDEKKYDEYL